MDEKTQRLLNQLATEWETKLAQLRTREVGLINGGNDTEAHVTGMTADTLDLCVTQLRETMTSLKRLDNHEQTITRMIMDLTK